MSKGRNGNKKLDRNKRDCERYRLENRHEKSKARKLVKHLRHRPDDIEAAKAYAALPDFAKVGPGRLFEAA